MSSALDTTLDDLIKQNKKSKKSGDGNSRGPGARGSDTGPVRRAFKRSGNRAAPHSHGKPPKAPDTVWQHDLYSDSGAKPPGPGAPRASSIETGTKIYISNLDYGVSNDDIKELFSGVGDLKRFSVHYDRSGRSKGTAEIVFSRRADAAAAVAQYNNVQLDGKPMKLEIVGTNIATPAAPANTSAKSSTGVSRGPRRRRGKGPPKQSGKKPKEKVSSEDLDADLEKYHSAAMQIN